MTKSRPTPHRDRGGGARVAAHAAPRVHRSLPRGRKAALAGAAITGVAASMLVAPGVAGAASLPLGPSNNLVVFPFRDMVVTEGWADRAGQEVTIEVYRDTQLMGAARGSIPTEAGAEFEINHPGGVCWGNDPAFPQVTPDIQAGDRVVAIFVDAGTPVTYETTVQDAHVAPNTAPVFVAGSNTRFTISGHINDNIPDDRIEQRIINPDLTDTEVGRRDIRAVVGQMTPAPKGGYSSMLEIHRTTDTFTATYEFTGPNAAVNAETAAASGGERALAWESAAGEERIGLTISEDDESGGPGMGGCPPGPGQAEATAGTYTVTTTTSGTTVKWTPATAQPDAPAVSGYSVTAVAKTASAAGERAVVGVRTGADATSTKLSLPDGTTAADYDFEVRAMLDNGSMGMPFPRANGEAPPPDGEVDTTPPPPVTFSQDQTTGAVTLSNTETSADIFYTLGDDPVLSNDDLGANATVYTKPIPVDGSTKINVVAFDRAGNHSAPQTRTFDAPAAPEATAPGVPAGVRATPGNGSIQVDWIAPANTGNVPLTRYQVRLQSDAVTTDPAAPAVNEVADVPASATTHTFTGLTNGRAYTVEVRAQNAGPTNEARSSAYTAPLSARPGDVVTAALGRNRTGDVRFSGTGSAAGVTITVYRTTSEGNVGNAGASTSLGPATVEAAEAPATGIEWEYRSRGAALPAGTWIWVRSSGGGVASFRI